MWRPVRVERVYVRYVDDETVFCEKDVAVATQFGYFDVINGEEYGIACIVTEVIEKLDFYQDQLMRQCMTAYRSEQDESNVGDTP